MWGRSHEPAPDQSFEDRRGAVRGSSKACRGDHRIEHLPWQQFIKTYNKPGTVFFLDPPYYKAPYYTHNFKISDFQELAETLAGARSNFVLSINDHPEMREVFSGFSINPVKFSYSAAQRECVKAQELLIAK